MQGADTLEKTQLLAWDRASEIPRRYFAEHACLVLVAPGTFETSSFSGRRTEKMYWYNPTTRTSERVEAPSTDEQAIQMLAGTQDSAQFIKHYCELRRSGTPIEQALVLVGHEFRLRQPEYQLALR
jgi:hypothetical protein